MDWFAEGFYVLSIRRMSYQAVVCELRNTRKHPNADRIKLATVLGNQVVIGLEHRDGEVGIFFPVDGQLSEQFCTAHDLVRRKDPVTGENVGGFFNKNRKVRAQKFRGQISEGGWGILKHKSFEFLFLEGVVKEKDVIDREEIA